MVQAPNSEKFKIAHLDKPVDQDRIGEVVPRGGIIGMEGKSGSATGYHAHVELLDEMGGKTGERNRRDNTDPAAFYERFYNSLNTGQPEASREGTEHHVRVTHEGLEHVRVSGLEPGAARQVEAHLKDFALVIRSPKNSRGFG